MADDATMRAADGSDSQGGSAGDAGSGTDDGPGVPDPNEVFDRRTLVKVLIALAFGIPILIEGRTFLGLLESRLLGGDEDDGGGEETTTREPAGVGVGDELLAATPQSETVESLAVDPGEDAWRFTMGVAVENDADQTDEYQFRVLSVTGEAGTTVSEAVGTDRLSPGESERITGTWALPAGERPEMVQVVGLSFPPDGTPTTDAGEVRLGNVPVQR